MERAQPVKTYRLTRNFALVALIVVVLVGVGLAYVNRTLSISQLERMAEQNNAALTQTLANGVWSQYRDFIASAKGMDVGTLRAHPTNLALHNAVAELLQGTQVMKVKLYDLHGLTAFSTDPSQIGNDYSAKPGFLGAVDARVVSELEFRETFGAIDGTRVERWVLASYVPIRPGGATGAIEGVAEIYSDVTDFYGYAGQTGLMVVVIVAAALLAIFAALVAMIWFAERQIRRYQDENLALAESSARAKAASKAKSMFLANMSHELRTPLNAIIGFAEVIKDNMMGPIGNSKYKEYADDIYSSGHHLLQIINDVLDLVKIETGRMAVSQQRFDPREVVEGTVKLLEPRAVDGDVTLTFSAEGNFDLVENDEIKFRQIMLNIVSNAIKFTPRGGSVYVKLAPEPYGNGVCCTVTDTGIGIAEEEIAAALAPFGQVDQGLNRRHDGTGLGLPLSHEFAELLGGDLRLESALGEGTQVTVTLPDRAQAVPHRVAA